MSMISEQIEELRLMAEMFANGEPYGNLLRRAADTIEMLSEKAREPKQGEWIEHKHGFWTFVNDKGERDGWIPDYECNLCGARAFKFKTLFCPTCGAKMKGADNE